MLEVLGDEYISQHIYNERYNELIETSYKVYMTDCIKSVAGAKNRWYPKISEMEKPQKPEPTVEEMLEMVRSIK